MRVTPAMPFYCGLVFGVGFLLGPIRVLWLEPRFGPIIATACGAPFMLLAILVAGRWVPRVLKHPARSKNARLGVGSLVCCKWRISRSASGCGASPQENNLFSC
jgi:hypothetical protein